MVEEIWDTLFELHSRRLLTGSVGIVST